jgi:dihydrofolate reductase
VLAGDPAEEVRTLKEEFDGTLQIAGSAQLAQAMIDADLIDEVRLMVFPVVLGEGKRFWGHLADKKTFALADTKVVGEGVAVLTLKRP